MTDRNASEITFYTNPFSRGRIAHWMLEEVGADYRVELVNFERGEHKRPEFLAINPMGKLPTIVHRGVVVTEAAAICTYLADAFPEAKLAPSANEAARGTYLRWLFFAAGCIEPALTDKAFPRAGEVRASALGYGSYAEVVDALEQALTPGPFILGERFSAADVYLGSQIGWGMMVKSLEPRPVFESYVQRLSKRPAHESFLQKTKALEATLKAKG